MQQTQQVKSNVIQFMPKEEKSTPLGTTWEDLKCDVDFNLLLCDCFNTLQSENATSFINDLTQCALKLKDQAQAMCYLSALCALEPYFRYVHKVSLCFGLNLGYTIATTALRRRDNAYDALLLTFLILNEEDEIVLSLTTTVQLFDAATVNHSIEITLDSEDRVKARDIKARKHENTTGLNPSFVIELTRVHLALAAGLDEGMVRLAKTREDVDLDTYASYCVPMKNTLVDVKLWFHHDYYFMR